MATVRPQITGKERDLHHLRCPICATTVIHCLIPHLRREHRIDHGVFRRRFGDVQLYTPEFRDFVKTHRVRRNETGLNYKKRRGSKVTACSYVGENGNSLIPTPDPTFVITREMGPAIEGVEHAEKVLIVGHSGTGKSSLCREIAARMKKPIRRVNLNGETSVSDLVGHWTVNEKRQTLFVRGVLPTCMEQGYILQLDEVDTMTPEVAFVLHPVLESDGTLFLTDTGETVTPHPDFRIIGTANTTGLSDDSGLYVGTRVMNHGWLDRWDVVVELDYLSSAEEVKLILSRHPGLNHQLIGQIVEAANKLRRAFRNHNVSTVLSTRRVLSLCCRLERGNGCAQALRVCVLNKMPPEDVGVAIEVFERCTGLPCGQAAIRETQYKENITMFGQRSVNTEELVKVIEETARLHPQISKYLAYWEYLPSSEAANWTFQEQIDARTFCEQVQNKVRLAKGMPYSKEKLEDLDFPSVNILLSVLGINPFALDSKTVEGKKKAIASKQSEFGLEEWITATFPDSD